MVKVFGSEIITHQNSLIDSFDEVYGYQEFTAFNIPITEYIKPAVGWPGQPLIAVVMAMNKHHLCLLQNKAKEEFLNSKS